MLRREKCRGCMKPSKRTETAVMVGRAMRNEQGSTLVESALALAVFFTALFGVILFSWAFYTYHYVAFAAREGSRYAMVRGSYSCSNTPQLPNCGASADEIGTYVKSLGFSGINTSTITVTVTTLASSISPATGTTTWSSCGNMSCNAPGDQVQVKVSYPFPLNIPFWGNSTLNVSSTSEMVIAQ